MIYPNEILEGAAGEPGSGIIINNTNINNNSLTNNCSASAYLALPDNAFSPTFQNNVDVWAGAWASANNFLDGDTFSWPDIIIDDSIIINGDGSIDGGEDFPDGITKVVSVKNKILYSSIITDSEWLAEMYKFMVQLREEGGTGHHLENIINGRYMNSFRYNYLRLFTYGEKEEYVEGQTFGGKYGLVDRGTGGILSEIFENVFDPDITAKYPFPFSNSQKVKQTKYASIFETNIKKDAVYDGQITTPCDQYGDCEVGTTVPIKERGIANGLDTGFSISRISSQINVFAPNTYLLPFILSKMLMSGILRIERLRTNYEDPSMQFWNNGECCEGGLDGDFAIENIRHQFIWQPIFDIPVNRTFGQMNPRYNFENIAGNASGATYGEQVWEKQDQSFEINTAFMNGQPNEGYKLYSPIFLAPGIVWRARLLIDPKTVIWTIGQILATVPIMQNWQIPVDFPDFRFTLQLEGQKILYQFEPEVT